MMIKWIRTGGVSIKNALFLCEQGLILSPAEGPEFAPGNAHTIYSPCLARVAGSEFWVSGLGIRESGLGFRVPGFRIRDSGFGVWVPGLGFRAVTPAWAHNTEMVISGIRGRGLGWVRVSGSGPKG
jgi:hypothetical protein